MLFKKEIGMRIIICDDERKYIDEIRTVLDSELKESNIQAEVVICDDCELLYNEADYFNIAFLDVEMQPFSGIEIARKLNKINPHLIIFIITAYEQYLDDAMDLNVFRFINKPINHNRLKKGIQKALKYIDETQISFFLKSGGTIKSIASDDIIYIESQKKGTTVVTTEGEFVSTNRMDFWKEKLVTVSFYRIHKSFIINMKHISEYKRDSVVLCRKYCVPVAYRKQTNFRNFFFDYFGGSI